MIRIRHCKVHPSSKSQGPIAKKEERKRNQQILVVMTVHTELTECGSASAEKAISIKR